MPIFRMTAVAAALLTMTLFAAGCGDSPEGDAANNSVTKEGEPAAETEGAGTAAATGEEDKRALLIGTWREIDGNPNATLTFSEDGVATQRITGSEPGESIEMKARWKFLDDGRLQLEMTRGEQTRTDISEIRFEGKDIVVTTDEQGKVERSERVKTDPADNAADEPAAP